MIFFPPCAGGDDGVLHQNSARSCETEASPSNFLPSSKLMPVSSTQNCSPAGQCQDVTSRDETDFQSSEVLEPMAETADERGSEIRASEGK
jgi:hypothetical protein